MRMMHAIRSLNVKIHKNIFMRCYGLNDKMLDDRSESFVSIRIGIISRLVNDMPLQGPVLTSHHENLAIKDRSYKTELPIGELLDPLIREFNQSTWPGSISRKNTLPIG